MLAGTWADVAAQSIVHGFVCAVVVETLIRLWKVDSADERLSLRLLAVAGPLVASPALVLGWEERASDEFRQRFAIFTARHWEDLVLAGVPLFHLWLAVLLACALGLLWMDLRPLVRARHRGSDAGDTAPPPEVEAVVAEVAARLRVRPPRVRHVDVAAPILFCAGVRRPAIVVSRGALALLDREELEAAIAHELAHLASRDPAVSWLLMGIRTLLFFNPAVQVVARAMTRDAELRADERATVACDRLALASALLKLFRATNGRSPPPVRRTLPLAGALAEPFRRARTLDVERRCRVLLDAGPAPRAPLAGARVALAGGGLLLLLAVVA
jgi:Zn-dependent protease with chaperone function